MSRDVNFAFNEFPTLLALANDPSYMRVVIGPVGSGKTSGLFAYALYQAIQQFPGNDGVRRTRTLILRQSYQQLLKSTVSTIRTILGGLVTVTDGKPPTGHARFPLPDGTIVDWELLFQAGDSPNALNDALGMEFTNMIVDEMSSLVDEDLVQAFMSRIGRYPSPSYGPRNEAIAGVLGATNGPNVRHFLYDYYTGKRDATFKQIEEQTGRPYFKLFQQPPALLLGDDGVYRPNPLAENIANLPGGYAYYQRQLSRSPEDIKAYIEGTWVPLTTGQVVFRSFRHDIHTIKQGAFLAKWGKQGRIGLSFDFGRTPVCLAWVDRPGGGIVVFDEFMAEDISIDGLWTNVVRPRLMERYPACLAGMTGYVTGDPSGADMSAVLELSPFQVLQQHGLDIEFPGGERKDRLEPRIEAVRHRLSRLDAITGEPMLQITDNCKFLIDAVMSGYVYEEVKGSRGSYKDTPTKTHVGWASDLCDALAYLCLYRRQALETPTPRAPKMAAPALLGG